MDALISAIMINGEDPFPTNLKISSTETKSLKQFSEKEILEYIKPFIGTALRFPQTKCILIHDGLPEEIINKYKFDNLEYHYDDPDKHYQNYERRFFSFVEILRHRRELERVWMLDIADVLVTEDPFKFMDNVCPNSKIVCGTEWLSYEDNPWFKDQLCNMPTYYNDRLLVDNKKEKPLTCGVFGGHRKEVLEIVEKTCFNIEAIQEHLDGNPPPYPVIIDMIALATSVFTIKVPFHKIYLDGTKGCSPFFHNRKASLTAANEKLMFSVPLPEDLMFLIKKTDNLSGWCPMEKSVKLAQLFLSEKPQVAVEIGVFGGRSLIPQALALKQNGKGVVYAIDSWTNEFATEGGINQINNDWWKSVDLSIHYSMFLSALFEFGVEKITRILQAPSQKVANVFDDQSIDFLHVDGNHNSDCALRDFHLYLPKLKKGGYLCVDDTNWSTLEEGIKFVEQHCSIVIDEQLWRLYRRG